jgi:hypothetical protein
MLKIGKGVLPPDYDLCLSVESPVTKENQHIIRGKYCSLGLPNMMPTHKQYKANPFDTFVLDRINMIIDKMKTRRNSTMQTKFKFTQITVEDITEIFDYGEKIAKLPMGICLPTNCSAQDIEKVINKGLH